MDEIFVTSPFMPPLEEFMPYLNSIWDKKLVTNCGEFHNMLETELASYLGVKYVSLYTNGTIALMSALKCLDIEGDVITTPYTFVATSNSILLSNLNPVFCDIDPSTLNIDPIEIKNKITNKTKAILATHVYGTPCDVFRLKELSDEYNLKLIYDAAHAFGVEIDSNSILNYGDLSVLSFHATKVFHTFEGGAVICHDRHTKNRLDLIRNFGIKDEINVCCIGTNGKMSEINSAFGLLQLKYIDVIIKQRKERYYRYIDNLHGVCGIKILPHNVSFKQNFSYFPIFVSDESPYSRDELYFKLKMHGINGRRYFYPIIPLLYAYNKDFRFDLCEFSNAQMRSNQVLCLPLYPDLKLDQIDFICEIIRGDL